MPEFYPATIGAALTALLIATAQPAIAQSQIETIISDVRREPDDMATVALRVLNSGPEARSVDLPDRIEARIGDGGDARPVWLVRQADTPATLMVQPSGFARAAYRFRIEGGDAASLALTIPSWSHQQVVIGPDPAAGERLAGLSPAAPAAAPAIVSPADPDPGNAFLANLSAYEPIYGVYGPGTDSDGRIQISFKYQLFGSRAAEGQPQSWRDGLHFAFTQRMFWDLGAHSLPFRNIDFQPEIFYLSPPTGIARGVTLAGQIGARHESNGRDGLDSRSVNSLYVAPMARIAFGGDLSLTVAPRLSLYVGSLSDNPDIRHYRGNTALFAEIGRDNGWRLSTTTRYNFGSGKGAINADLSYPLKRLLGGGPDFYLFGQAFAGYGENLLDYDRRVTRLRIGVALVR